KQYDAYSTDLVVEYAYDAKGRNDVTTSIIAGKSFVSDTVFDSIGRVYESYDPSGSDHGLRYTYKSNGYLYKISETKAGVTTIYRQIYAMNAFDNVIDERFGNGVKTERLYNPKSGRLNRINTTYGGAVRQNLEYTWDNLGRLKERESITKNLTETFGYDSLNRIKTVNGVNQVDHDSKGNITWKKDVGSYTYGASCGGVVAGHHAVSNAGGKAYCYDLNGNMVSGNSRTTTYSIFDKATKIIKGGHTTEFAYGSSRSRYKRVDTNSSGITTTFYLGGVEYIQKPNGEVFYRRSIPGAVIEVQETGSMKVSYLHTDHLGSTDVITRSNGTTEQEYSFDIFGKKRLANNWSLPDNSIKFSPLSLTSRAYTGHESADEVGVIHMNGRIYDPALGRFMQADPHIDGATDSQGFNRYSYVRNNPLAYTDPTGFKRSFGLKLVQGVSKCILTAISL
ncbi:MAG: RHS repeat-associated core domain-containing protein, partial [Kangiellaceae bacterium]|nr:RHS repeat-associated core domain-containing protein [Kangiellaceae bacterium]